MIDLPFSPGDIVYYADYDTEIEKYHVRAMKVKSIEIDEDGTSVWCEDALGNECFALDDFGEIIFTDKADAFRSIEE